VRLFRFRLKLRHHPVIRRRTPIHDALDRFGRAAGFEKHAGRWYRREREVIAASGLQKSQYGPQYFNQGFWLRTVADASYPRPFDCHIVARLDALLPDAEPRIRDLLDLESALDETQRVEELVELLRQRLTPIIQRGGTVAGLSSMVADGTLSHAAITREALEAFAAVPGRDIASPS
jgi:hypothetical protein